MRLSVLAALPLLMLSPAAARADGFHCGTRLVSTGDTDDSVVGKCGEPDRRAPVFETTCWAPGWCQTVQVGERWTYDLGPDRLVRHLMFRDQKLAAVEQGGYGHRRR